MIIFMVLLFVCLVLFSGFLVQQKFKSMQEKMQESFKAMCFDVMQQNGKTFLDLAETSLEKYTERAKHDLEIKQKQIDSTIKPLHETIQKLDQQHRDLEKKREGAYSSLVKQIDTLVQAERQLSKETTTLSQALRSPQIRGSWGQVHLKRVVELAGLLNHCDFFEQKSISAEGRLLRPDLVVELPGSRHIIVDAKAPLNAYLEASETSDESLRQAKLSSHAAALRKHMRDLSSKGYWNQFELTPEYVILFLPAEAFFSAALQSDPHLIEMGVNQNIIIATPTTLIAILRAVAFSWKQESLSKSAKEIADIGEELYQRLGIVCDHWTKVGKNLNTAVQSYNQSISSLESRVLVSARKLKEVGSLSKEIPNPEPLELLARETSKSS